MSPPRPLISRDEMLWAGGWAALLMALTCLPYLAGLAFTPYGGRYLGFVYNPDEPNVHQAWIRQAWEGRLRFENRFTSEPHQGRFFNVFLLATGRFARLVHLDVYWAFQLARLFWGFVLLVGIYLGLAPFILSRRRRRLTFLFIATSSGLGWLYVWGSHGRGALDPIDTAPGLAMPEAITFLTVYLNPLFAFSVLLLLVSLTLAIQGFRRRDLRYAGAAGVVALVLANSHTYDIPALWLTLGLYVAWQGFRRRRLPAAELKGLGLILLLSGPAVLYQAHLILSDPLYGAKANTWTPSPGMRPYPEYRALGSWAHDLGRSLLTYGLSYGLLVPLAGGGLYLTLRRRQERYLPFILWLGATLPLLYAPVPFQRKMAEGMHLPLGVLAAAALDFGSRRLAWGGLRPLFRSRRQRRRWYQGAVRAVQTLALAALIPSNLHFIASNIGDLLDNNRSKLGVLMPPHYLNQAQYQGLQWLSSRAQPDDIVLCTPLIGNYLPARAGCKVFVGHWAETIHFGRKVGLTWDFFGDRTPPEEKQAFLQQNRIRYVFLGPYERALNTGHVERLPCLREVFHAVNEADDTGDVWIYEVVSPID